MVATQWHTKFLPFFSSFSVSYWLYGLTNPTHWPITLSVPSPQAVCTARPCPTLPVCKPWLPYCLLRPAHWPSHKCCPLAVDPTKPEFEIIGEDSSMSQPLCLNELVLNKFSLLVCEVYVGRARSGNADGLAWWSPSPCSAPPWARASSWSSSKLFFFFSIYSLVLPDFSFIFYCSSSKSTEFSTSITSTILSSLATVTLTFSFEFSITES